MAGEIGRGRRGCDPDSEIGREIEGQIIGGRWRTVKFTQVTCQRVHAVFPHKIVLASLELARKLQSKKALDSGLYSRV